MLAVYQVLHAFFLILLVTYEVVKSLSRVRLFVTPWTAAHQSSPSPSPGACSKSYSLSR